VYSLIIAHRFFCSLGRFWHIGPSTQWQLMEELTSSALLVFPMLENLAANGHLIHNDDIATFKLKLEQEIITMS